MHDAIFISRSPEQTEALGQVIGSVVEDGDVLVLQGDLAAGKTVFVRGLAAGMGADTAAVHSPTFALLHTYQGRIPLQHFDLYRLEDPIEMERLGFTELLEAGYGVSAVEWGAKFSAQMPAESVWLTLEQPEGQPNQRILALHAEQAGQPTLVRLLQALRQVMPKMEVHS